MTRWSLRRLLGGTQDSEGDYRPVTAAPAAGPGNSGKESAALNARLVLLLANHIGSLPVLREALALARAGVRSGQQGPDAGIGTAAKNQDKQA